MHDAHTQHPHHPHNRPGRSRHRRDDFGFGPGFGGPFGRGPGGRGRKRMRRGDVRAAILVLLDEEPRNGYQLMQEIEERSEGAWRPSPGSVYPALQQLEDEGLVKPEESDGRKQFTLTGDGVKHVEDNREKLGEPWANLGGDDKGLQVDYWKQVKPLIEAVKQVAQVGNDDALKRGGEVLADARRKLYAILAEDRSDA
jgi:DNA-binding PadR family transcriptional regulator